MASYFESLIGTPPELKTQNEAKSWYRSAAAKVKAVNEVELLTDKKNIKNAVDAKSIGQMYMFFYDPKHKATLPFYDKFPLVFPIEYYNDGFLGLNLHYLPRYLRAKLMDSLYGTINNSAYDDSTKLKISYQILKSSSRFRYFKPCVKRYLASNVRQNFLWVEPKIWDWVLLLPTERFAKRSMSTIHGNITKELGR